MKYKQITQTTRPYEYGKGKEFTNKEQAKEFVEKKRQKIMTDLSLNKCHSIVKISVIEIENAFQLVAKIRIPQPFEKENEGIE